jgi:flagellar biosynthesis/type III secretory pathway chaperone
MKRLNDLAEVLNGQRATYQRMLDLEEEKSQALMVGDTALLTRVMSEQQALMVQARGLEDRRAALCESLPYKTLGELVDSDIECREALEPVFTALRGTVLTLKKKNARNRKLLEARLATVRFMNERLGLTPSTYSKGVRVKA